MHDFNTKTYKQLLHSLLSAGYHFSTFLNHLEGEQHKQHIILRHDVEKHYTHALQMAKTQHLLGIRGTYFFRILPHHYNAQIVKHIAEMGHEVAYHYDDLTACKGDKNKALESFVKHLEMLRAIAPVSTICMDGSPRSRYDNKDLWQDISYQQYGIVGEPYFDMDFDTFFYLTDTGRRWDGWQVSVRDKVAQQEEWRSKGWIYHSTHDIITAINTGNLPNKIMMTFHPQRWHDDWIRWTQELLLQNAKNIVKRFLVR